MDFKGPEGKVINRLGNRFASDSKGLLSVDIDNIKKIFEERNEDGQDVKVRETLTEDEKKELVSTLKAYSFSQLVKEGK